MSQAFVIGNGESRKIYPITELGPRGMMYGCNAVYRDYPTLCHKLFAVNDDMYTELAEAKQNNIIPHNIQLYNKDNIVNWDFILPGDYAKDHARMWHGEKSTKKGTVVKTIDHSKSRGSGVSAVLQAAHDGHKQIFLVGFDIIGSAQWSLSAESISRTQNNIYKNTKNYPPRKTMKAYLKFEWCWQLRQIARKYKDTQFYYINRIEVLENVFILHEFMRNVKNWQCGTYADLKRVNDYKPIKEIRWKRY